MAENTPTDELSKIVTPSDAPLESDISGGVISIINSPEMAVFIELP